MRMTQIKRILKNEIQLAYNKKAAWIFGGICLFIYLVMLMFCGMIKYVYPVFVTSIGLMALFCFSVPFTFYEYVRSGERGKNLLCMEKKLLLLGESRQCFLQVRFVVQMAVAAAVLLPGILVTYILYWCFGISTVSGNTVIVWLSILHFFLGSFLLIINPIKHESICYFLLIGVSACVGGCMGGFFADKSSASKGIPLWGAGIACAVYLIVFTCVYLCTIIRQRTN